jgi:hypothetical protein
VKARGAAWLAVGVGVGESKLGRVRILEESEAERAFKGRAWGAVAEMMENWTAEQREAFRESSSEQAMIISYC